MNTISISTQPLALNSPFAVSFQSHLVDEFLGQVAYFSSAIAPSQSAYGTSYEIAIPAQQLPLEQLNQLTSQSAQLSQSYFGSHSGAIATPGLSGLDSSPMALSQVILAQQFEDSDLAQQVQDAWNNFVGSGQIWALCVGLIFGYMFRTFTGG